MKKYALLAFAEILLIFIGVSLSTWFTNWNDDRKERKAEQILLEEFREELLIDLQDVKLDLNYHKQAKASSLMIIHAIDKKLPYHDSLKVHFSSCFNVAGPNFNTAAYEKLKSAGMNVLTNDSLRIRLVRLYDLHYKVLAKNEEYNTQTFFQILVPFNSTRFDQSNPYSEMIPVNYNALMADEQYKYYLKTLIFYRDFLINLNQDVIDQINYTVGLIDKEINKNQ